MTIAGGSAIAQAIPIVLTPILTRLYSPGDMGLLGLYTAFISFAANGTTLGYSQAIVSGKNEREGAELTAISVLIVAPMSVVGAVLLLVLSYRDWLGFGELPLWTSVAMALSLALTGLFFSLRYWLVRTGSYRVISTATVTQSIGRIATQIVTGAAGVGWAGLVLGEVVGRASGLRSMWIASRKDLLDNIALVDAARLRTVASAYRKFPLLTAPSSLLNSLSLVLPIPLITMYYGLHEAGQFAIASRIMILPLSLVGAGVGDVFHSRIARLSRESPERAMPLFTRVVIVLFALGTLPMLVVWLFGEELFRTVLGAEWKLAGSIAAVITPWVLMQFSVNPVSRLVQVYQGQEFKLIYDILALVSIIGILTYGAQMEWSIVHTLSLLGWSQAIVYVVYLVLLSRILKKHKFQNHKTPEESSDAT
jgi:O-antigen/teichoic acid export membrane protein